MRELGFWGKWAPEMLRKFRRSCCVELTEERVSTPVLSTVASGGLDDLQWGKRPPCEQYGQSLLSVGLALMRRNAKCQYLPEAGSGSTGGTELLPLCV